MDKLGSAIGVAILVILFLAITAAIISVAPYLALMIIACICWCFIPKNKVNE